jgi:aminoglycoside 3-N-acetyltransferase
MARSYAETDPLITTRTLCADLTRLGVSPGQILIVHSSMKKIAGSGFIVGGAQAVIEALMQTLTPNGTLIMPTHTTDNTDPAEWQNPPVPDAWKDVIRAETPAFHPYKTPSRMMGVIPELFRTWPGVVRSNHPIASFAAWGRHADYITREHPMDNDVSDPRSPIGRIYELDGSLLLIGVPHHNNTALHMAERIAQWEGKKAEVTTAMFLSETGEPIRVRNYNDSLNSADFTPLGNAYEAAHPESVSIGHIGAAESRLMQQRPLVDFAVNWMNTNRPASLREDHA